MPSEKSKHYCGQCQTRRIFSRRLVNHAVHIPLSIVTGGLWLISYLAVMLGQPFQPWTCSACGHPLKASPKEEKSGDNWQQTCRRMYRRIPYSMPQGSAEY